jgi:hypothetical protein
MSVKKANRSREQTFQHLETSTKAIRLQEPFEVGSHIDITTSQKPFQTVQSSFAFTRGPGVGQSGENTYDTPLYEERTSRTRCYACVGESKPSQINASTR